MLFYFLCIIFVAKMFIQRIHKKTKNKIYTYVYLVENYRENGKIKHRLVSNLSNWPDELVENFDKLLKGKSVTRVEDLSLSVGKSFGAIKAISEIAKRLGIKQALGSSRQGKMALFQIAGRIITQGSRNYLANSWKNLQAVEDVFNLKDFTHNNLYDNLNWLAQNQDEIEQKIFNHRSRNQSLKTVYLYDVTSSYLEGDKNELAKYGYNRDKKKGKKQIVIGLLTDSEGYPVSVEVFKGNTHDTQTVSSQLAKLKERFGVERVVFVGDKGMVKSGQIEEITSDKFKWNYLTTITKEQIRKLIKEEVFQLDLFAEKLVEVKQDSTRYILRRNPERAAALQENRKSKIERVKAKVAEQNTYLSQHTKAQPQVALRKIQEHIARLNLKNIIKTDISERTIHLSIDEHAQEKAEELDGCYVVKTDVPPEQLATQKVHDRYKDLAKVEFAFRTFKTTMEEVRPVFVRKEENTRGHVFVVMLAYMIIKYITDSFPENKYNRKYIFESLDKINYAQYTFEGKTINIAPKNLLPDQQKIIETLKIKLA